MKACYMPQTQDFQFWKGQYGHLPFWSFFPKTCCFVRILWKQVLFLWKIFSSTDWSLSEKQNSNVQPDPSHSWQGPLPHLLVSAIVCFVVFSSLRPFLSVDFKAIADGTAPLMGWIVTKALLFPFQAWTLQSPIPPATSLSLPFLHLPVRVRYHSSHSLIALLLFSSSLRGLQG